MNEIRGEWPLVVFTTLAPICTGSLATACALSLAHAYPGSADLPFEIANFAVLGAMAFALACSTLHLGRPLRALRALTRLGNSNVANEVFAGGLFVGFAAMIMFGERWLGGSSETTATLLVLLVVLAALFTFFQCYAYRIRTVETWNSLAFSIEPALTAFRSGICLETIIALPGIQAAPGLALGLCVVQTALTLALVTMVFAQKRAIEKAKCSRREPDSNQRLWGMLNGPRLILAILGTMLWSFGIFAPAALAWLVPFGCILTVAEMTIGRISFYVFYKNVGIAHL